MKTPKGISNGQIVFPDKVRFSKKLRREMTPEERILWAVVRNNQLDGIHFRRQQIILGYIVDFYCEAASLAIELDGGGHESSIEEDAVRDGALSEIGIKVIRIPNIQVREDLDGVLERLGREVRSRKKLTPDPT